MKKILALIGLLFLPPPVFADDLHIDPLAIEHAFLEKKLRFDFSYRHRQDFGEDDRADMAVYGMTAEWALGQRLGLELETALIAADPAAGSNTAGMGDTEIAIKFLPWKDEARGWVTALSFAAGLPTGSHGHGLGEGRVELEPGFLFLKAWRGWVLQGQYAFAWELGSGRENSFFRYRHSLAYPVETGRDVLTRWIPMFEVLGELPLNGSEDGQNRLQLMPGLRVDLLFEFSAAFGVKFPVGGNAENETEVLATVSRHF